MSTTILHFYFATNLFESRIKYTMNIQQFDDKALTTLAFLIGLAIIDSLDSTEQNAVGGFIMLVGQTVSTSGGFKFNRDWKGQPTSSSGHTTKDALKKASDIMNREINKL